MHQRVLDRCGLEACEMLENGKIGAGGGRER